MTRLTMPRMRDNIDAAAIGKSGLANDQCFKRNILKRAYAATSDPVVETALRQQDKQAAQNNTAKQHATMRCKSVRNQDQRRRKDFKTPEGFNECGIIAGRSYASRAGERMEKKQAGFPDVMRHPTTLDLMAIPLDGNLEQDTNACRPLMRRVFGQFSEGSQIEGKFQIVLKTAAEIAAILPSSELPSSLDPIDRAEEVFALLHWHGIIADPYLTKNKVRKIVKEGFPGCHRVCVAKVQPERINRFDEITHGAQGYFEYSALDKTEVKFSKFQQVRTAVIGYAHLGGTWNKRNRSFSMGKPLAVTGIQIDPSRVVELELMERLDAIKANWKKLSYAEQFIHLWFSGIVAIIRKPQTWLRHNVSVGGRFIQAQFIIKNWAEDKFAQDVDFIDYVDILLE